LLTDVVTLFRDKFHAIGIIKNAFRGNRKITIAGTGYVGLSMGWSAFSIPASFQTWPSSSSKPT